MWFSGHAVNLSVQSAMSWLHAPVERHLPQAESFRLCIHNTGPLKLHYKECIVIFSTPLNGGNLFAARAGNLSVLLSPHIPPCLSSWQVTRAFPDLTAMPDLSLGSALAAVLVALVGGFLLQHLLTRFKYDLYKIPLATGSVPILGTFANAAEPRCVPQKTKLAAGQSEKCRWALLQQFRAPTWN